MAKRKKLVLVFEFDEEYFTDEDWTELTLKKIKLDKRTSLSDQERDMIAEEWGQSDQWHVDIHNDILHVIDTGDSVRYG